MDLCLIKMSHTYKDQLFDMMDEWLSMEQSSAPYSIFRCDYHDFDHYLANLEVTKPAEGLVPDSTWFCLDRDRNILVGAVNIRHYLNEKLLESGGHIGDGVRPSERRKGVATAMIGLALEKCRTLGITRVLITCDRDNIASAKSIQRNGGVLEDERYLGGKVVQRYWIDLV